MVVRTRRDAEFARWVGGGEIGEKRRSEESVHARAGGVEVAVVEVEATAGEDEGAEAIL